MNLYRGVSGADYGHPLNLDWNSGAVYRVALTLLEVAP